MLRLNLRITVVKIINQNISKKYFKLQNKVKSWKVKNTVMTLIGNICEINKCKRNRDRRDQKQ